MGLRSLWKYNLAMEGGFKMSEWETFCDISYYHLWRVRRKNERGFNDGFHLQHGEEAKALVELLNRLERERAEARDIAKSLLVYAHQCLAELEKWGTGSPRYEREMNEIRVDIARVNWEKRNEIHPSFA
jgi:hypothetical protein